VAAIRAATGLALNQVPVRPEHITGLHGESGNSGKNQESSHLPGDRAG
jgi:hypothetical protein